MRTITTLLAASALLSAVMPTHAQANEPASLKPANPSLLIEAFSKQLDEDPEVPAYGLAVVTCASINLQTGGLRRVDDDERIGSGARFNIGSNAKSMLATAAARLHDRGVISLNSTIGQNWPEILSKHPDKAGITLEQLLSHSSGMPSFSKGTELDQVPSFNGTHEDIRRAAAEWFLAQPLVTPPGETTTYSNAGYVIAGYLLEKRAGVPLGELLQAEVFGPIGIAAAIGEPRNMPGSQPWGHYVSGGTVAAYDHEDPPIPAFLEAAGNVSLTPLSYARYLQANLCAVNGERDFLAPATARQMHRAVLDGGSGLGWGLTELNSAAVSFHVGGTGDFTAFAALSGDLDRAALAVVNVGGAPAQQAQRWLIEVMNLPKTINEQPDL